MFSSRRLRSGWLCSIVAAVAAACSTTVGGQAVVGPAQPGGQPVRWGECHVEGGDGGTPKIPADTRCGDLTVPIDYAAADAGSAHLSLIRFPATGQRIGSLVLNPGGPGESGVNAAAGILDSLPASVRQHFDVVGFDPRGVGGSTPSLVCNSDAENDAERADTEVDFSPPGIAHIEDLEKRFGQRCVDKVGRAFLAKVGTANVVKDLDALRAALGDDKLTYLGYSYGTLIGSLYAEAYPDHVRAMILDGVVDPNEDPVESSIGQAAGFQRAFDAYAADCARNTDCPLGTTNPVAVFHRLVDPLTAQAAHTADPRGLSYSDAVTGTQMALYSPTMWKHLTTGLRELTRGRGDTLLALSDAYMGRDGDGHYTNSTDALISIDCVDHPAVTDRAEAADLDRRTRDVAPFLSYGAFNGAAPLDYCAFWPVPATTTPHPIAAHGLPATLEVSTVHDPATPYQAGVDVARELGGTLLTYEGTQHTVVFQGDRCVDDVAAGYLVGLKLPPADTRCR